MQSLSVKNTIFIGLMLFALFFGAGNLIFPPLLGQQAGENLWSAIGGFLITGVGLPLLGIIAIARSGGDLQMLANKVHPFFGLAFAFILYLAIGPFFGIPRTGTVAYEIGMIPFLPEHVAGQRLTLFLYLAVYFTLTAWLSMNPSKLVDRIGKILTPGLIIIIAVLVLKSFITPMGSFPPPIPEFEKNPFFSGFIEGYLTMDTIAALVFGLIVVSAVRDQGITNTKSLTVACVRAGLLAALGLGLVYLSLAWLGATSVEEIGVKENGGAILAEAAASLYGASGTVILALAITFACLTTSIGLVSACAKYFSELIPRISYQSFVIILVIFSTIIATNGLTKLISLSLPVLIIIYPLAIVLIILSFLDHLFHSSRAVYAGALIPAGFISLVDGLKAAGFRFAADFSDQLSFLPFFAEGVGWIVPALIGAIIGYIFKKRPSPN